MKSSYTYIDHENGSAVMLMQDELFVTPINADGTISRNPDDWGWLDMSLVEDEYKSHYGKIKTVLALKDKYSKKAKDGNKFLVYWDENYVPTNEDNPRLETRDFFTEDRGYTEHDQMLIDELGLGETVMLDTGGHFVTCVSME